MRCVLPLQCLIMQPSMHLKVVDTYTVNILGFEGKQVVRIEVYGINLYRKARLRRISVGVLVG